MQLESIQEYCDWFWKNVQNIEALVALIIVVGGFVIWLLSRKNKQKGKTHITTFKDKVNVRKDFVMRDKITHTQDPQKGSKD